MLNFSSDFLNLIGTNEIESFNKTLNEMLVVWNNSDGQQQQPQSQANQQLRSDLNTIMGANNSFLPIPTPSLLTNSGLGLSSSTSKMNSRSFLTSSQQLDTFFYENQSLFSTGLDDKMDQSESLSGNDEVSKVFNEINRGNKEFQPVEIIPLKSSKFDLYEPPKTFHEFSQLPLPTFQIDSSKLDELRTNPSVLDPLFSLPYNTSNPTYIPTSNNSITNSTNNFVKQESTALISTASITQSSVGPMRSSTFDQPKEKDSQSTLVSLSKDQLNTFSTTEMEEYENVNQNIRELSSQEKKDLKRQKRLIKNRESAHLSRQRKRERLTELEHRVEELTHNSGSLNKALSGLESENLVLKAEVNQLIDVIKDSPVLSALFFAISNEKDSQMSSATAIVY